MRFWTIAGGIAAVLSVGLAAYLFYSQRTDSSKRLEVQMVAHSRLVDSSLSGKAKGIELMYNGHPIANYELLQLRVVNVGGQPIRSADYEEPLRIILANVQQVLSAEESSSDPPGLIATPKIEGNVISISPLLMNPTDFFTLTVGVVPDSDRSSGVGVLGRIVGIKSIGYRESLPTPTKNDNAPTWLFPAIIVASIPSFWRQWIEIAALVRARRLRAQAKRLQGH